MSWKSTGVLVVTSAVLFVLVWTIDRPWRAEQLRESSRVILPDFNPASVTNVSVKLRGRGEINAARLNAPSNIWELTRPIVYAAEAVPIHALLDSLTNLTWQVRITAGELKNQPNAQTKYGFANPIVEIALDGTGTSQKILVGQSSALGDQVFLEVVGNPDIYLVNTLSLQFVPINKDQWRDPTLLNLKHTPFQYLQVRSPGKGFDLVLTNNLWFVTNPVSARADTPRVNQLLSNLDQLWVREFVSDDPKVDLDQFGLLPSSQPPSLDLTWWQGTNLTAELQTGSSLTNQTNWVYARRANPSNVVAILREPLKPWQGAYSNFLDYHLISVSPSAVAKIVVHAPGEARFEVDKKAQGEWLVNDDPTFPADAVLMRYWLASFTNIQTQIEKTVATDFSVYGLTTPVLQYTLSREGDATNAMIADIFFGTNKHGRIFERRTDEKNVNLIPADDFARLPRAGWQLRDRRIWSFDTSNVMSMTVHESGVTRKYLRDPEGEWTFAPGYHGPPEVNWLALEEGVHRIGGLRAVYWTGVGDALVEKLGFKRADFSLTFAVREHGQIVEKTVSFGGRSPYSYPYASVMKNGQRLIFEFPVDLYDNFVDPVMSIPIALRYYHHR